MRQFLLALILVALVSANPSVRPHRNVLRRSATAANSTSVTSPAALASNSGTPAFVSSAWFTGWHANAGFPVSSISWAKYTHMIYAFATTTPDVNSLAITPDDEAVIPEFVSAAHAHGLTASISVGGWTGSLHFSTAISTAKNRKAFVQTLSKFVAKYNFDGIDFDWEYPNDRGVGCNSFSPKDTAHFLLLLQELRSTGSTSQLILSAATPLQPFLDASGSPSADVSGFAQALDFIEIMNYDVWGPWSTTVGPNSPLADACAAPENRQGSAQSAVAAWSQAGIPPHQIVLGTASYGHSFRVANGGALHRNKLAAYPAFIANKQPAGDPWDDAAGPDVCGVMQPVGGTFDFWGLIAGGFLTPKGDPAPGIKFRFDQCSQTAYVYDAKTQVEVSFDNALAFKAKGAYIKSAGLRGFAMWEAGGDHLDILLDAIRQGAGVAT